MSRSKRSTHRAVSHLHDQAELNDCVGVGFASAQIVSATRVELSKHGDITINGLFGATVKSAPEGLFPL